MAPRVAMALPKVLHIMGAPIVTLVDEPVCSILVHEKMSLANIWHSWLIQLDATTHVRQPCVTAMAPRVTMVQTAYTMCADHPLLPPRSWRLIPAPALLPRPGPASSPPSAFSSPPYLALLTLLALGRPIIHSPETWVPSRFCSSTGRRTASAMVLPSQVLHFRM